MHENEVTAFGGIVGRVLRDATSLGTVVTAFLLGTAILTVSFVFSFVGNGALAQIVVQVVVAAALARFALNGLSGEFRGTILSTAGGSWALAFAVAARYLVLNLIWMAPMAFLLWQAVSAAAAGAMEPGGPAGGQGAQPGGLTLALPILAVLTSKAVIASVVVILFGMTLLPPIFLIVAVRAERFGQIFTAEHWRAAFAGRFADLYVIYAIHGGGIGMMIMLAIPVVLLAFFAGSDFGKVFACVTFGYMGALAVTLLGRLCGFFAFGEEHTGPVHATAPAAEAPAPQRATAGFTPRLVRGGAAPAPGAAGAGAVAQAAAIPVADASTGAAAIPGADAPDEGAAPAATEAGDDSGLPMLPDAAARAAAARTRFATDRDGAIEELQEMQAGHAPSPEVLHALALCLHQAGRAAEALDLARQVVPLCIERGLTALAAELFATFWKQAKELHLDNEQIDAVASSFMKSGDLARAVSAYGLALIADPADRRAVKGLLRAADQRLHKDGRPRDAAKIYTFLLQYAPSSPFSEDMRQGLAEAEARLARAS